MSSDNSTTDFNTIGINQMTVTHGAEHPLPQIVVSNCLRQDQIVVHQNPELIGARIEGKVAFESARPGKACSATINIHVHGRVRGDVVMQDVTTETGGSLSLTVIIRREISSLRIVLQNHWAYARGLEVEILEDGHQASNVIVRNADSHMVTMKGDELVVVIGVTPDQFSQPI